MAGNENVIESLKLELNVTVNGQDRLTALQGALTAFAGTLEIVNAQLREYQRNAENVGQIRMDFPTVAPTPQATPEVSDTGTVISTATDEWESFETAEYSVVNTTEEVNETFEQTVHEVSRLSQFSKILKSAVKSASEAFKSLKAQVSASLAPIKKLGSQFLRIAKMRAMRAIIRGIIKGLQEGVQNLAQYDSQFNATMTRLTSSTLYLKNAMATIAQPLLEIVIPALEWVIDHIVEAINKLNAFIAAVKGEETYTAAVKATKQYADNTATANENAKELKRTLMGFDEINKLNDNLSSAGKAGGGLSANDMFETRRVDKTLNKDELDFAESLKMTIDDVFFDWDDLNAEQIAEKVIVGLGGVLGAATGFALGGVPGAILGTIAGVGLGLIADSLIFNHDGVLSAEEVLSMLIGAIGGLTGGLIGWRLGGKKGALIGADIGVALGLLLGSATFDNDGVLSDYEVAKLIAAAVTGLCGGVITFLATGGKSGVKGTLIGASVGVMLSLGISALFDQVDPDAEFGEKLFNIIEKIKEKFKQWGDDIAEVAGNTKENLNTFFDDLGTMGADFKESFKTFTDDISQKWDEFWTPLKEKLNNIKTTFKTTASEIGAKVSSAFTDMQTKVTTVMSNISTKIQSAWNGVTSGIKSFVNSIISGIEFLINKILYGLNWLLVKAKNIINTLPESVRNALHLDRILTAQVEYVQLKRYATGGFPEDGLFMANHGELVGQFANGRTAVANNQQIEAGIEEAAYRGFMRAMQGQGGSTTFIAQLNGKTIFEEVVRQNNNATKTYGSSPLTAF